MVERLTQQPIQRFQNAAMTWGTEQEPAARAAYERITGLFRWIRIFVWIVGIGTLADSLSAIRTAVFEERRVTLVELVQAHHNSLPELISESQI